MRRPHRRGHGHKRPQLSRRHEFWLYCSFGLLLISGAGWLASHYVFPRSGPFGAVANPAEAWWLRLHGAAMIGFLVAFGALLPGHVSRNWRAHLHRRTGGVNVALVTALALSGYGLYYLVGDQARAWTSLLHWGTGLLWMAALALHVILGKRRAASLQHPLRNGPGRKAQHPVRAELHRQT